jgi:hypothetical protein
VVKKKRRFSQDSINDLLFWGFHLFVVALSLAVVWTRIDKLTGAVNSLLTAQSQEIVLVQKQLKAAEDQTVQSREQTALSKEQTAFAKSQADVQTERVRAADATLKGVVDQVAQIQTDVTASLEQVRSINQQMLDANKRTAAAAEGAENAASNAASTSMRAANASASARSIVARKVVTTQAKEQLDREKAQLAAQQKKLRKVIRNTKLRGPTVFQKIFQ